MRNHLLFFSILIFQIFPSVTFGQWACSGAYSGTVNLGSSACTVGAGTPPDYDYKTSSSKYCVAASCGGTPPCYADCPSSSCWGCPYCGGTGGSVCTNGPLTVCSSEPVSTVTNYYCPGTGCSTPCVPNSVAGCITGPACCKVNETDTLPPEVGCTNARDDDCDGLMNCDDPDCFSNSECNGEDINLRMFDGTLIHKIAAQKLIPIASPSELRVKHLGFGRGVITVSATHPLAIPLKININGQNRNLREFRNTCTIPTVAIDCGGTLWSGATSCSGNNLMQNGSSWSCTNGICTPGIPTNQVKQVCITCACPSGACACQ